MLPGCVAGGRSGACHKIDCMMKKKKHYVEVLKQCFKTEGKKLKYGQK